MRDEEKIREQLLREVTAARAGGQAPSLPMLQVSDANYRLVVENAGEGIVVAQDGMLRFVNTMLRELLGYTEAELTSRQLTEFIHPDDRAMVLERYQQRLRGELAPGHAYPFRVLTREGKTRWMEVRGAVTSWEGKPATVNFLTDITERREAEDGLHRHIAFEKLILSLSTDFINREAHLIDSGINDALRKVGEFVGADRSYVFQFTGNVAHMSNTHEWCAPGITAAIQDLQDIPVDTALPWFAQRIKAHEVFHVPSVADLPPEAAAERREFERESIQSLICVPMVSRRGLIGFLGFDSVRTRRAWSDDAIVLLQIAGEMLANALMRKQSEDALRDSEERFRLNFEQAAVGIVECTLAGRYQRVNRRFCEITGYTGEELRSMTFREVSHPDDIEGELQAYAQVLQGKAASYVREKRYLRKDRSVAWVNASLSLVRDAAGVPKRFVGVIEDITYRKRMEQDLLRAQKLESLGILAGGIAHDFNNMLAAIVGQIAATRLKLQSGDPLGARLEEIEKATLHARTLTQQLLTFSKGGAPVKNTLSLVRLVGDSANLVLSGTSVTHSLSRDEGLWSIDADEGQMSQAFNNLLINACQAMPGGGNISIRMENFAIDRAGDLPLDAGNYVRLTIADEGIGIPPEIVRSMMTASKGRPCSRACR